MKVGIIGFGRLGKLAVKNLAQDFTVYVYDQNQTEEQKREIRQLGATPTTLPEVASLPYVLPIVPISAFESVINEIKPHLTDDCTVIDACSVKSYPIHVMKRELPENVQILGTHPMFGPDSARDTLFGNKVALCPVRLHESDKEKISKYLQKNGIKVIETTPEEHDKQIAHTLLLTHFVGRGLLSFGANPFEIDTKGYRRLMKILLTVKNDSWQLFKDMNRYNPYAQEIRENFLQSLQEISSQVDPSIILDEEELKS